MLCPVMSLVEKGEGMVYRLLLTSGVVLGVLGMTGVFDVLLSPAIVVSLLGVGFFLGRIWG